MRSSRLTLFAAPLAWMLALPLAGMPAGVARGQADIGVSITIAPPFLPIYVQPPLPSEGYVWTPGFWDFASDAGYYWVPGTWVLPPAAGLLWTPAYWSFDNGFYVLNRGYWGPRVGFYGGIDYGFGYGGTGFVGGEWRDNVFVYNRLANNFGGRRVANSYERTPVVNTAFSRVSFNGPNGTPNRPSPEEAAFARVDHVAPTELQRQHERAAAQTPNLRASINHGSPVIAATTRPGEFRGPGVAAARPAFRQPLQPAATGRISEPAAPSTPMHPAFVGRGHAFTGDSPETNSPLRVPAPVMHGPPLPQQRFNVTRPANPPPVRPAPPEASVAHRPADDLRPR